MTINVQKIKFAKAGMAESCSPKVDVSLKNSVKKTTLSFVSGPVLENSWCLHPVPHVHECIGMRATKQ